jgi:hypothetical protein
MSEALSSIIGFYTWKYSSLLVKEYCRNNVNSPVRTSAIRLLQHLQLLYLPSELDITKYIHNEFTYYLIAIKPQTL